MSAVDQNSAPPPPVVPASFTQEIPFDLIDVPEQARKQFDIEELRQLSESIKENGLLQFPVVEKTEEGRFRLVIGERRFRAMKMLGWDRAIFRVMRELGESRRATLAIVENLQREDLKEYEVWLGMLDLLRINPGWTNKDLSKHLNKFPNFITKYLSASNAIPNVQEAFKAGRIGVSKVYVISQAPPEKQQELLDQALSQTTSATRDSLARQVHKAKNGDRHPAVRQSRVRIPLGTSTITVSGSDLGMEELVEALAEALKEARKASGTFDIRTFQRMMADKAG